jgi:hypothetical protein
MTSKQAFRAVRCVNHDGRRILPVEHRVERQGPVTPFAAGLVRSNPLFSVLLFGATTRTRTNSRPAGLPSQKGSRKTLPFFGDATEVGTPAEHPWPRVPLEPDVMLEDPDTWLGAQPIGVPC